MSGWCRDAAWLASGCDGQLVGLEGSELVSAPVVIDSRKVSDHGCFVAIVGENVDGHDYASAAYNSTTGLVIISSKDLDVPHIRVQDTVDALGKIAYSYLREIRQYREANGLPFDVLLPGPAVGPRGCGRSPRWSGRAPRRGWRCAAYVQECCGRGAWPQRLHPRLPHCVAP